MAKDRFNRFKPINWNSGFKQTGSFIKPESKKQHRSTSGQQKLLVLYEIYRPVLTEWENEFLKSVISLPFELTDKQREVIKRISMKHPDLLNQLVSYKFST
jgi:hypothetical protein